MPRAFLPRNPQTGEREEADVLPDESEPRPQKHGPERVSMSLKLATERHARLLLQNDKLRTEQRVRAGELVEFETIKRRVLLANHTVRQKLLGIPSRIKHVLAETTDPEDVHAVLTSELVTVLNELAYEHREDR